MDKTLLNYIIQAILGGASGYITNDYAINMLFKEYTPLKLGGVIKKTRHEFIENIGSMVENDIINKDKLQEVLSDDSFKKEFETMTSDFFENSLYEEVGIETFAHIDGFEQSNKSTKIFAQAIINEHMPELYKIIAKSISFKDFLSSNQLIKISGSLYSSLADIIINTDIVKTFMLSVIKSNDKLILNSILDKDSYNKIISNAVNIFLSAVSESDTEQIDEFLTSLGLGKALSSSKEILGSKKVREVIKLNSDVLNSINESLLSYVNSEKGINVISSLLSSLFSYGKECDKSIFQLLDTSFEENLKHYLIKNIPSVTENVVAWININSHLIDKLIEEAIDEVIEESDGIKARLLSVIKNTYFKDLSRKYSIANKIITYVEKISEPEKLSRNLSDKLIEILNNLTLREIIVEAESNNITSENAAKIVVNYINKNSEIIINKAANYVSEIEINKLMSVDLKNDELKLSIVNKLKELASSNFSKKYLTNKSIKYFDNILSKELKDLVDDEKAKTIALKMKEFISSQVKLNEIAINSWIKNKAISYADANSSLKLSSNAIIQLNTELYKSYEKSAERLKDMKLSAALDKLNLIDNLAKNSSESIRTYAVKNADVILSGTIKAVVTDNLNKLDDDELVNLANDFIGRELRPIMYFGGILGVAAGLILAAFQNKTLNPAGINIVNMAVYAFVGYITNVIAINMIFKPYKEIRLLSKIPFLRNFALGYIIKNQKIFAKNTAHFIDNSLLSKKSINELFYRYKDKINFAFTKSIKDNDYKTLNNLVYKNKYSVAKSIYEFIRTKISCNALNLSEYIYHKISSINVSTLINDKVNNTVSSSIAEELHNPRISRKLYSLISSDKALESKFSGNIIKKYINDAGNNCLDKLSLLLSTGYELTAFITRHEDKYQNQINRTLNETIDSKKREDLAHSAADIISSIVLSKDSRDQVTQKAVSLINRSIDKNKSFGELFNGKFKDYVNSQMPKLLEGMTSAILNNIKGSKAKISLMIQKEIKNQLGFIEKSMYNLMGGDEIIDELLSKIILIKIPRFLDDKRLEINSIANILLEEKLYKSKVEVLYTGLNKLQLNELVDIYLNKDSEKIEKKISTITMDLFSKVGNVRLESVLSLFYANELNRFLEKYKEEINAFTYEICLTLTNNKLQIAKRLSAYTGALTDKFTQINYKELFAGISEHDLIYAQDKIFEELNNHNLEKIINICLNDCKSYFNINTGKFIDKDAFIKAAEKNLMSLIENSTLEKAVKDRVDAVIDEAVQVNFSFINDETKNYLLNIFVESCINSLKRNLNEVLKSIEFDVIAQEEIEKMKPEKIHELFDSFAGKYFSRLMLYGLGGIVFGVNVYVGFSLALLKMLSEIFKRGPSK